MLNVPQHSTETSDACVPPGRYAKWRVLLENERQRQTSSNSQTSDGCRQRAPLPYQGRRLPLRYHNGRPRGSAAKFPAPQRNIPAFSMTGRVAGLRGRLRNSTSWAYSGVTRDSVASPPQPGPIPPKLAPSSPKPGRSPRQHRASPRRCSRSRTRSSQGAAGTAGAVT